MYLSLYKLLNDEIDKEISASCKRSEYKMCYQQTQYLILFRILGFLEGGASSGKRCICMKSYRYYILLYEQIPERKA